jgi:probable DNA metabolism protein
MKTLLYDGSFPGFLFAAEKAGYLKHSATTLRYRLISQVSEQPELYGSDRSISTNLEEARLFYRAFRQKAGTIAAVMLRHAFQAEKRGREEILLSFIRKALHSGPSVCTMLADPDIKTVHEWSTAVCREKHRYMGILRFRESAPAMYRADFSPRYNICKLLAEHFTERMHDVFWLIVDNERHFAAFHKPDDSKLAYIKGLDQIKKISPRISSKEDYEMLWRDYFQAMEIRERKNSRCQANFIPKRDRVFMTEFAGSR